MIISLLFLMLISLCANTADQKPAEFISNIFNGNVPKAKVLWLTKKDKADIADILQHKFSRLRVRYWQSLCCNISNQTNKTVWVLNEIGKEKPITIGVYIHNHQIMQLKVLTYRESRGDEVRHSFFTDQFKLTKLSQNKELDRHIDGITGATLSVRALTKVARLSLWLDKKVATKTL